VFDIPLRALYSRNVANLFMAGRNISATHAAFTSTRVMATCAVIGQAVGAAAAVCCERGIDPRQLANNKQLVSSLQQSLVRQDQSIRTVPNRDAGDLARQAQVTASTEAGDARAALVIDGIDRDIPANKATSKPAEVHHWGAPLGGGPAWIELAWPKPQRLRSVVLKFDSGFQRELTLTASDSHTRAIIRAPQPETVRDYMVEVVGADGQRRTVATVTGNHQRLNRVTFDALEARSVRVTVSKSNGHEEARIFEIRCYA
jgi:hypothetical protein